MRDLATRGLVIRTSPDADLYTIWSMVADAPMWIGTETDLAAVLGDEHADRLTRAREHGTSSHDGDGGWDDSGFVAEQVGWLPRTRMHDYVSEYQVGGIELAKRHLEPFDDEPTNTDPSVPKPLPQTT